MIGVIGVSAVSVDVSSGIGEFGGDGGDHRRIVGAGGSDGGCIGGGGGAVSEKLESDDDGFIDVVIEFVGINGQVLA